MINRLSSFFPWLLLFCAGLVSVLAYAPFNRPLFIIIALIPIFWYAATWQGSSKSLLLASLCYGFGFYLGQLYWIFYALNYIIHTGIVVALLAQVVFSGTMGLFIVLALGLFQLTRTRSLEFNSLFLLPSCWVFGEWLRGWVLTGFPWSDVGYTQVNNYLLQGVFPLGGSYAVSWLCLSISGFLFVVMYNHKLLSSSRVKFTRAQRLTVAYFILLAVGGYGLHDRLYTTPYGVPTKVALVQANINQAAKWDSAHFENILDTYAVLVAQTKADIVLLPETALPVFENSLPLDYENDLVRFAQHNNAELVVGMPKVLNSSGDYGSAAIVLTESGHPFYAKRHLVPFGEFIPFKDVWSGLYNLIKLPMVGFSAGADNQPPLVLKNQKIAFNICYENGFGSELTSAASQATLMVNLSDMVWFGDSIAKDQHLQLSQARALENQRYFIQETNTGDSAIIDYSGHIQSSLPSFESHVLADYVQGRVGVTPYQKYGNYPIVLFMLLIILVSAGVNYLPITRRSASGIADDTSE